MDDAFRKFDLTGKTALVTGGATGIGYYMTRGLMRSGAKVMVAAHRENVLKESAAKLRTASKVGEVLHHGVNILIGNAAIDVFAPVDQYGDSNE